MGELDNFLNNLGTIVAEPQWLESPESQANTIIQLGEVRDDVPAPTLHKALELLSLATGHSHGRLAAMIRLSSPTEIVQALSPADKPEPRDTLFPRHGWLWDYVRHSSGNEAPTRWHWWCGLSVLGAALKRKLYFGAGYFIWPNNYIMIVENAASKKTTAINVAKSMAKRLNRLMVETKQEEYEQLVLAPESGTLAYFLMQVQSKQRNRKDLLGKDVLETMPANGYVVLDDLVTLFSKSTWQPDLWIECLTSWWDYNGIWENGTLSRQKVVLKDPAMSFLGGTTTDWLRNSVTQAMLGGGFISRCMYIVEPAEKKQLTDYYPVALRIDPVSELELAERLLPLSLMPRREFRVDQTWVNWWNAWYMDYVPKINERHTDAKLISYYRRRQTQLQKIAMLLAVSEGATLGSQRHLETADAIMTREEQRMDEAFAGAGAHKDATVMDDILNHLRIKQSRGHSELINTFYRRVGSAKKFREIMDSLIERGVVMKLRTPGTDRGITYRYNGLDLLDKETAER